MDKEYEITQGNKLIHEFMGKEVQERYAMGDSIYVHKKREMKKGHEIPDNVLTMPKEELDAITEDVWYNINDAFDGLKYNRSWDWLMVVVKKIQESYQGEEHHIKSCEMYDDIERMLKELKIEWVWQSVIKFITWYNQIKK